MSELQWHDRYESEYCVCGQLMVYPERLFLVELRPEEFGDVRAAAVYEAICDIHADGGKDAVDPVTIEQKLGKRYGLDSAALMQWVDRWDILGLNLEYHAQQIREQAAERALRAAGAEIARSPETGESLMALARLRIEEISRHKTAKSRSVSEFTAPLVQEIENAKAGIPPEWFRWGNPMLDRLMSVPKGGAILIGARPGGGKSLMCGHLRLLAASRGERIAHYNTEMGDLQDHRRVVAQSARVDVNDWLVKYRLSDEHYDRYLKRLREVGALPMWVLDRVTDSNEICKDIVRRRAIDHVTLVVVDHLTDMHNPTMKGGNRTLEMAAMLQQLKRACTEGEGIPVATLIVAAMLHRPPKDDLGRAPTMSDFKYASKAEEIADVTLLIHDPHKHDENEPRDVLLGITDKYRHGSPGVIPFRYDRDHGHILGVAARRKEEPPKPAPVIPFREPPKQRHWTDTD